MQVFPARLFRPDFLRGISLAPLPLFLRRSMSKVYNNSGDIQDLAVPNEAWSKDSLELFTELKMLTSQGTDWQKIRSVGKKQLLNGSIGRLFARPLDTGNNGKFLEYAFFCSPSLQSLKGVIQFGIFTIGPPEFVHGGAIATTVDMAMGIIAEECNYFCVTANLNVDYVRPIPVNSTVYAEASIDKVEGRKVFVSSALKTVDRSDVYAKSTALFVLVKSAL